MKKMLIVFALLMAAASSYAFCEYGNKVKEYYEGNHKVAVYDFGPPIPHLGHGPIREFPPTRIIFFAFAES